MTQVFRIHSINPQRRLLRQAVDILQAGGVIVYPTDTSYALGCQVGCKEALERIKRLRRLDDKHHFTIICRDLSELGQYASVSNASYRFLKNHLPGPFTFILNANRVVPKRLLHPKRKTVGIRVPDNIITQALLAEVGGPLITTSMIMPEDSLPICDPEEILERVGNEVDLVIDGGFGAFNITTLVQLEDGYPEVIRQGEGQLNR